MGGVEGEGEGLLWAGELIGGITLYGRCSPGVCCVPPIMCTPGVGQAVYGRLTSSSWSAYGTPPVANNSMVTSSSP